MNGPALSRFVANIRGGLRQMRRLGGAIVVAHHVRDRVLFRRGTDGGNVEKRFHGSGRIEEQAVTLKVRLTLQDTAVIARRDQVAELSSGNSLTFQPS